MESTIGSVLGRVGEYVDCHKNFHNDVDDLKKGIADLKRRRNDKLAELLTVDDSERQVKEEVQGWLEDARRVTEIEMPDIEEEVQNVSYLSRGSLGRRVRQKIQDVREIYNRGSFPESLVIERPPPIGITLPTENMVGEVDVKEKIWGYLMSHEVGIIGVCGIGGVGKTTVMKHIHNELLNEATKFKKVVWVTVSHPLIVFRLQGDIASAMNKSLPDYGDELKRASRLMEVMKTVKYALILDDVWDKFTLHRVGIPEPTTENGCKIVITSRSVDVCNYLRCQMVKVPLLSAQESLNLFLDKVGQDILRIPNLEEILKLMVAECAGLPLAIVVIAGSMRGVEDIFEWRNALRELRQCVVNTEKDSEDEIFNRLKFSHDRLRNSSIQNCFLYCSLYPEDWVIRKENLIENWICEGLVEKLGSRREMHDKGHVILNRLLNNCLIEEANKRENVKMHDVVRDMALRVKSTGPSKFMVKAKMRLTEIPEEDEWTEDLDKDIMETVKYALILDDVWDKFDLQRVGIPEPTTENGCKIVITSRSVDVCNYLGCQIVKVPPLPQQESLNLFLDKVGQDILRIPNLEKILKDMVAECAGLPLAIVVIAGSMKGVTLIRQWRSALRRLRQCVVDIEKDSEDQIFQCLKFSYDRLPNSSIQECLLYCSLYSEDWVIQREDLIEDWICDGLVEKLGSRREMHDRGHEILSKLENNCLLEEGSDGYLNGVKMHDVVRDMALRVKSTGPSKFMVKAKMRLTEIPEKDKWTEDIDKVSLMYNEISYIPINMFPKCLMLSTLILEGNLELKQIPECFLANMPLLKFLNLSYTGIEALPNSMCSLKNLTALILCACESLERMPSLSKLKALKKLDLDEAGLYVAPEGIEMLENLEYLDLSAPKLKVLPKGKISKLFRLQYLRKNPIFSTDIRAEEVARLNMLECFEGIFDQLKDLNSFVSKLNQFRRPNNYWLRVGVVRNVGWYFGKFHNDDIVRKVALSDCNIGYEEELVLPDDLRNLLIGCCNMVADISISLRNLTQLQTYELYDCQGIECVVSFSSSSSSSLTAMNNLEKLCLFNLFSLRDIVKVEKTTASLAPTICPHIFSNLKHLIVRGCGPNLKKLFPCELLQGQGLQNLEQIIVNSCWEMEEIIGWEEEEVGNQTTTPILIPLPKLRILGLKSLPKLKRIYPEGGVMACDSLNSIYIIDCPKVKRIPLCLGRENGQPSLAAMKEIYIESKKKWWESLEWENPDDEYVFLPFIKYIG
ncbi:hypothetical protein SLEP1_g57771 [Rubroshorea leprosula]|nr:hypothetical protein SLEP1_g57771 [Rubroshorea leprosula]